MKQKLRWILKQINLIDEWFENNEIEKLQNKEKLLLETLIEFKNELVFYDIIEENVWEGDSLNKGTLKVLIGKLRQKIGKNIIINENEQGYRLLIQWKTDINSMYHL